MSKVRVYEIAKQLNMDQKSLVALFQSMGIGDVRNHMSAVEVDVVERVKRHLERQKTPEIVEERIRPTVVKRRARATDTETAVPSARPSSVASAGGAPASFGPSSASSGGFPSTAFQPSSFQPSSTRAEPVASARPVPSARPSTSGPAAPAPTPSAPGARTAPQAAASQRGVEATAAADEGSSAAAKPTAAQSEPPAAEPSRRAVPPPPVASDVPAPVESAARSSRKSVARSKAGASSVGEAPAPAARVADLDFDGDARPAPQVPAPAAAAAAADKTSATSNQSSVAAETSGPMNGAEAAVFDAAESADRSPRSAQAETKDAGPASAAPASLATGPVSAGPVSAGTVSAGPVSGPRPSQRGRVAPEPEVDVPPPTQASPGTSAAPPAAAATPPPPPPPAPKEPAVAVSEPPRRPSSPPRTGIDVWQGRPGVPMPQTRSTTPQARRTTYDPRASAAPARPTGPTSGFINRPGQRPGGGRPGFHQNNRRNVGVSPASKRPPTMHEMAAHKKVIKIEENVSLQKLAGMMSLKVTDVLIKLLGMGMTGVNINSTIDADTAKILASEFGWTVEDVAVSEEQSLEAATGLDDKAADKVEYAIEPRPPIVTVMGHVDHGKTSLLDRIRKASVAAGEAGGITQHIGAYRVETPKGTIAFLDTPGHEAFTAMRARGAQVTDVVVLVVAADDGVMPQTREAINHAQSAKVPIIVAVNKIDKPSADPDRVKRDLANFGLTPEEWGGETLFCHVSALTGQGIDQLLEAIALQSEVLELSAAPKRRAHGVVIEALLDRGRGPVARVMVQDGTLREGDILLAGPAWGKVRAMTDEFGRKLVSAGPATPVEVLGLNEVPSAGDPVHAVKDAKQAEEIAEQRRKRANKSLIPQDSRVSLEALKERLAEGEQLELKLIIKGDVQGSVEAVASALIKLSTPKVKVTIVHAAVGAITEGDVNLGIASKAVIVGFNVRPAGKASQLAESGGVEIRLYTIIYNAVDDIRAAMEGLLPTTKLEKALGAAEVRKVFKITKVGTIAGCYVTTGVVKRGADARLVRDGIVVYTGKIATLRRIKDDAREVAEGLECGIALEGYQDIKENDMIEAFEIEEVKQKL